MPLLPVFVQLSENEKRFIFVLLLALIIAILIVVGIGYLIVRIMKRQSERLDSAVYDVVTYKVITNEKDFKKYARKKNCQLFIKDSWLPLLIILIGGLVWLIRNIITDDFSYNILDKDVGFASVLFLWDFKDPSVYGEFFGITLLSRWPDTINTPHLVAEAWSSYVTVPCFAIGGIWYIFAVQGFFARLFRTRRLAHDVFLKSLKNYNQIRGFENSTQQPISQSQSPINNYFDNSNNGEMNPPSSREQ